MTFSLKSLKSFHFFFFIFSSLFKNVPSYIKTSAWFTVARRYNLTKWITPVKSMSSLNKRPFFFFNCALFVRAEARRHACKQFLTNQLQEREIKQQNRKIPTLIKKNVQFYSQLTILSLQSKIAHCRYL